MRSEILQLAAELSRQNVTFAFALVVRREPASSAQPGNLALVTESGEFHGWLGGSCIRPTVLREASAAIEAGTPRLISLSPDPGAERRTGVTTFPMTCHSGGTVEIYLEPVIPAPRLIVFGVTPTAQALVRLGKAMGYAVEVSDPDAEVAAFQQADRLTATFDPEPLKNRPRSQRDRLFAVVATQGERDEDAALEALAAEPAYLAVVASRERFRQIRDTLLGHGVSTAAIERIRNPAGVDIDAKAPEEIALSILAEIVKERRGRTAVRQPGDADARASQPERPERATSQGLVLGQSTLRTPGGPGVRATEPADARTEVDPVCGMSVTVAGARHTAEHGGRTYYFCCGRCRQRVLAAPDDFAAASRGA